MNYVLMVIDKTIFKLSRSISWKSKLNSTQFYFFNLSEVPKMQFNVVRCAFNAKLFFSKYVLVSSQKSFPDFLSCTKCDSGWKWQRGDFDFFFWFLCKSFFSFAVSKMEQKVGGKDFFQVLSGFDWMFTAGKCFLFKC